MSLTVSVLLGINIFTIHHNLVMISRQDMWISVILGGILSYLGGLAVLFIALKYPRLDLPEIMIEVFGKIAGRIFIIIFTAFLLTYAGFSLRIFSQVVRVFLLDKTPTYSVVLLMCIVVVYTINKSVFTICNISDIIFPVFLVAIVVFMLLSLKNADIIRIEPIMYENTSGVINSIIPAYRTFAGYGIVAYFIRYMKTTKESFKWFSIGMTITIFLMSAAVLITLLNFGPDEIKTMVYPFLALSKTVELPNTLIERLEGFMIIIWIPISFIAITVFTFATIRNTVVMFGIKPKDEKTVNFLYAPILIFIALFSSNSIESQEYFDYSQIIGAWLGLGAVPVMLIAVLIKSRRRKNA